ncbi:hypothetical protein HRbin20_01670 [bacterium HR20]|nr:hypothetical protein HRbin20_01670 [bacterium HR20]
MLVEREPLGVPMADSLDLDKLRVEVVRCCFRHRWECVVRRARPRGDADIHSTFCRILAQITPPLPGSNCHLNRTVERQDAHFAVAAEDKRTNVAGAKTVPPEQLERGMLKFLECVGKFDRVHLAGILQSPQMVLQPKHCNATLCRISTNPLEPAGSVVQCVREHVDVRFFPWHKAAVHPDRARLWNWHA